MKDETHIALMEKRIERLEDHYEKHADILFDRGGGLSLRIDRLERSKANRNNTFSIVTSIVSTLIALASIIIMLLK